MELSRYLLPTIVALVLTICVASSVDALPSQKMQMMMRFVQPEGSCKFPSYYGPAVRITVPYNDTATMAAMMAYPLINACYPWNATSTLSPSPCQLPSLSPLLALIESWPPASSNQQLNGFCCIFRLASTPKTPLVFTANATAIESGCMNAATCQSTFIEYSGTVFYGLYTSWNRNTFPAPPPYLAESTKFWGVDSVERNATTALTTVDVRGYLMQMSNAA